VAEIAVIVPAHNAEATIGRTLDALARQTLAAESELVVVDDGSTDSTAEICERAGARVVRLAAPQGPGAARNAGVAATTAPLLAFTDADCEPSPGWLEAGAAQLGANADLVTGPIRPNRETDVGPFDRTLEIPGQSPLFESANVFVSRALFERLGGFQRPRHVALSVQNGHFGEDVVFGWRAVRAGARVGFDPDAVVFHAVFPRGPGAFIAERWRLRFFPFLVREVPELREALPLKVFLSERTATFDLAVAGAMLAIATRRRWPLIAAAPYLWQQRRGQPWRRSVLRRHLVHVTADLVGAAALLSGSWNARTLVA
jgi:glycosyltransferase involved in cell wall biosynthesis